MTLRLIYARPDSNNNRNSNNNCIKPHGLVMVLGKGTTHRTGNEVEYTL